MLALIGKYVFKFLFLIRIPEQIIMTDLISAYTFRFYLLLLLFFSGIWLSAQEKDTLRIAFDQILILNDTTYFGVNDSIVVIDEGSEYEIIKNFLVRNPSYYKRKPQKMESVKRLNDRYGRILMGQIYNKQEELPEEFNPSDNYYSRYNGRFIKDIQIERVAVLDGNVFDTSEVVMSTAGRFLNSTYSPTKERVIRNNLKFSKNEMVNARVFSDNERLLRELSYIEDARIQVIPDENSLDSVIVVVVVKDRYPFGIGGTIDDYNAFEAELYSRNFLGNGHNLGLTLEFDGSTDDKFGYGAYYGIGNMGGTFINGNIRLNKGVDRDIYQATLAKPFVTTYTKFGGEGIFEHLTEKAEEKSNAIDSFFSPNEKYTMNRIDLWVGYSFVFPVQERHPFLNIAGRFYLEDYTNVSEDFYEYNYSFHDNNLYLASLSFQQVSYIKTSKLFQYGTIEDVPVGFNLNLTGGWQRTSFVERPYAGARLNYALFSQTAGIFSVTADVGAFQYESDFEDLVSVLKLGYASPLIHVGALELRNLLQISYNAVYKPRYLIPILYTDYFTARSETDGFYGNENIAVNYHPIFYTNYNLYGFRFSVDPFMDIGKVNKAVYNDNHWDSYSVVGVNLSTKNESLIFPALHLQFAYYLNRISDEPRFRFKLVFKDIKLFKNFTELKPRIAEAIR